MAEAIPANIDFYFKRNGFTIHEDVKETDVYLDLGNRNGDGVIDHHGLKAPDQDTATLLLSAIHDTTDPNHEHLVGLKKHFSEGDNIRIYTHVSPDTDSICSSYILLQYLQGRQEELAPQLSSLAMYSLKVDQGDKDSLVDEARLTVYTGICLLSSNRVLQKRFGEETSEDKSSETNLQGKHSKEIMADGLALAACALGDDPDTGLEKNLKEKETELYKILKDSLEEDYQLYLEKDQPDHRTCHFWCESEKCYKDVKGAIFHQTPESDFSYIYARREGYPFTIVPWTLSNEHPSLAENVFLSLDEKSRPEGTDLKMYQSFFEQLEQLKEAQILENAGYIARNRGFQRPGENEGILGVTDDPWHLTGDGLLLCTPRSGSALSYETIIDAFKGNPTAIHGFRTYELSGQKGDASQLEEEKKDSPASQWIQAFRHRLQDSPDKKHFAYAEPDSSLIGHDNEILKEYCLNAAGMTYSRAFDERFFVPSYNMAVYTDARCTIILCCRPEGTDAESAVSTDIGKLYLTDAETDKLSQDISTLYAINDAVLQLEQRIHTAKAKEVKSMRTDLSSYVQQTQALLAKDAGSLTQSILRHVYDALHMDERLTSTNESLERKNADYAEETFGIFNKVAVIFVPVSIISDIIQTGFLHMDSIFAPPAGIGWSVVLIITIITLIWMWRKKS